MRQLLIHSLRENTFFAYLNIEVEALPVLLDCRPSDGIVLAKRGDVPSLFPKCSKPQVWSGELIVSRRNRGDYVERTKKPGAPT